MFASTMTLQMSTVAINVSTTHLASCNQREYDPPMCASTDPDVCKQLQLGAARPASPTQFAPLKYYARELLRGSPPPPSRGGRRGAKAGDVV